MNDQSDEILAVVSASPVRRWSAVGMQVLLGAMLLYIAFSSPPALGWQLFLMLLGAGALWLGIKSHQGASTEIFLTRNGLHDSTGKLIVALENIRAVERGVFALKPSNGFMLILKSKSERHWVPGIWWRFRRRVGIGGIAPGHQAKAMAQIIEALLVERDAD